MIQATTKRSLLAWGATTIGSSLTVLDVLAAGTEDLAVSILCNFSAGFLLALFTLTLALNSDVLRRCSGGNSRLEIALWVLWPFTGYVTLATALFLALSFLTTVPTTPLSFRLEPSLNGYYVTREDASCGKFQDAGDELNSSCQPTRLDSSVQTSTVLSILGNFEGADNGDVAFIGGGKGLTFQWTKGVTAPVTGSIWVAQGCAKKDQIGEAIKSEPIFQGDLARLDITLDEGLSEFRVIAPKRQGITVHDDDIAQFWVRASEDSDRLEISRFLGLGTIRTSDRFEGATYEIALFPLTGNDEGPAYRPRQIIYNINNGAQQKLDFAMESKLFSPKAEMTCEPLPTRTAGGALYASAKVPYVSIFVVIDHPKLANLDDANRANQVTVSGANGWITSSGYAKADLHEVVSSGSLTQLSLIGAVKDLSIDGLTIPTGTTSTLQLRGRMQGRTDGPSILMQGRVDYLIFNGKRLTTTRWEQLDTGVRIPLILGIPTAAYFMFSFGALTLRKRVKRVWQPPVRRRRKTD